ncbi:MAG: DUF58 domain-containing protein [Chloroflexota bacterium]
MNADPAPKQILQLNSRLLPALCLILLVMYIVDSYRGWSILLISFGGAWLVSYIWARSLANGLSLRREMRFGWAQVGDRLEERFTLINRAKLPALWVEITDQTNMPNYWANQVRGIDPLTENRWYVRSVCTHRGLFNFGPTILRARDPLGIYTVTLHDPAITTMLVMPPVVSLPPIQVAPGGRAGEGTPRVNAPERTVSSASVREYLPGDSLRWIHWPTSARREGLFVRVFEGAPAGDWWIILDLDHSVQVGEGQDSTQEHGIILAASLANLGMRSGHSVGLVTHGEDLVWLSPQMSDEHNWTILRALALIEPGKRSLADLLDLARPSLGQNTSLIVISSAVKGAWVESLLAVRRQRVIPTVLMFDPISFGGEGDANALKSTLSRLGIVNDVIPRDLLDRREIRPGREGHWEWRVTPLGRAIAVGEPEDLTWRNLVGQGAGNRD